MTLIKILNGQRQVLSFTSGQSVWCDRRSALGNPFELRREASRDLVCDAYQEYFDEVLEGLGPSRLALDIAVRRELRLAKAWKRPSRKDFMAELEKLEALAKTGDLGLGCWCAPRRCHCDTIAAYLTESLDLEDENTVKQGSLF